MPDVVVKNENRSNDSTWARARKKDRTGQSKVTKALMMMMMKLSILSCAEKLET